MVVIAGESPKGANMSSPGLRGPRHPRGGRMSMTPDPERDEQRVLADRSRRFKPFRVGFRTF